MLPVAEQARKLARKLKSASKIALSSYPKNVECNLCGWSGSKLFSDAWHENTTCPKCGSDIRQRLFFAALSSNTQLNHTHTIDGKSVLHFAPEAIVTSTVRSYAREYATTDYLREDCDLKLDMSDMSEVKSGSYDVVISFDVLEHVPDYRKALQEVSRILSPLGLAVFTVPQKDDLTHTYENPSIVTPEEREKHFGQYDHLRIFGDDFKDAIEGAGFSVTIVDASSFSADVIRRHVLFPPILSSHPLATNHRRVFFCRKKS